MGTPLKVTTALPCTEAAELMNQLSLGLMHGTLIIRSSEQRHAYHPGQVIRLEIRAEENGDEGSMHIGLHWRVPLSVTTSP
ncbi:MAG TPA: amphi-Trp domain-containing protein [bacterium]|nr:amphi-Trp domain-containing protein [bacterium]